MNANDLLVKCLTFLVPYLSVLAASDGNLLELKVQALALTGGCGALLALLHPPTRPRGV